MASIFGIISDRLSGKMRASGTDYARRTNENVVKAATGVTISDGQQFANLPPIRRTPQRSSGGEFDEVAGRQILNDPREVYWGALPNKIDPKQAMFMVRAAMAGDLWQFWRLTENMLNTWPKFAMAQHQLREAVAYVRYVPHPFTPKEGETLSDTALEKRDLVQMALAAMAPNPFNDEKNKSGMIYNFTDAVLRGISLEEIIWKDPERAFGGKKWQRLPKASAWTHPRHFSFNQQGNVVIFNSGTSLDMGDYRRFGKGVGELPDPNKMICSQFMSRSGSSVVNGFAMQIVWWWCARQYGLDFILQMARNFGNPFVDVAYKGDMSSTEKLAIVSEIIKGLSNRVLIHKELATLTLQPAQNLGTDNPQRWLIEESDREVLYILLGQTGSTISTPGKLGGEDTHNDVKKERVAGVAEWVAQNPLEQFARAVLRVNYGNEDECPCFKPDFTKPLSPQEVSQLLTGVKNSGLPVIAEEICMKTGFTMPQTGQTVFHNGEFMVMSDAMTEDEKQEKQFDQQIEMQQAQAEIQGNQPEKPVKSVGRNKIYSQLLGSASEADLNELETLVTAAERAPHANGEITALEMKLKTLNRRK